MRRGVPRAVGVPGAICAGGGMLPGRELCVCCKSGLQRVEGAELVKDTAFHAAIALLSVPTAELSILKQQTQLVSHRF